MAAFAKAIDVLNKHDGSANSTSVTGSAAAYYPPQHIPLPYESAPQHAQPPWFPPPEMQAAGVTGSYVPPTTTASIPSLMQQTYPTQDQSAAWGQTAQDQTAGWPQAAAQTAQGTAGWPQAAQTAAQTAQGSYCHGYWSQPAAPTAPAAQTSAVKGPTSLLSGMTGYAPQTSYTPLQKSQPTSLMGGLMTVKTPYNPLTAKTPYTPQTPSPYTSQTTQATTFGLVKSALGLGKPTSLLSGSLFTAPVYQSYQSPVYHPQTYAHTYAKTQEQTYGQTYGMKKAVPKSKKDTYKAAYTKWVASTSGETMPKVDVDVTVPKEMITDEKCQLCSAVFNSPFTAEAHYLGKKHAVKENQYVKKVYEDIMSGKSKRPNASEEETENPAKKRKVKGTESETTDGEEGMKLSLEGEEDTNTSDKPIGPQMPMKRVLEAVTEKGVAVPFGYVCEVCSIRLNSALQYEQHIVSKKHLKNASKDVLLSLATEEVPVVPFGFVCSTCNIKLNSASQYEQHIVSKKHLGKVEALKEEEAKAKVKAEIPKLIETID